MLCVDDEPLMLKMLEMAVKEAKPDADITAFRKQADLLEDARKNGSPIENNEGRNLFFQNFCLPLQSQS
jgi:hypothetical protein